MRRSAVSLAVISVILAAGPLRIEAGLYSWDEPHGGDYEPELFWDPWDPPSFPDGPDSSDDVEFGLSDRYVVTFNSSPTNRTLSVLNGEVTFAAAGGSRWYSLNDGITINSARLFLGGPGDMMHVDAGVSDISLHSGGQLDIGSNGELLNKTGYIGEIAGPTAIVTVKGGSWTNSEGLYVGGSSSSPGGDGELNVIIGGTVNVFGTLKLWSGGWLDLSDGHVTATSFDNTVGGTYSFTGGQLTVDSGAFDPGTTTLILDGAGNPTLNLNNGAAASFANDVTVGNSQSAALNVNNSGQLSNSTGYIGREVGSIGTVTVQDAGSSWTNTGSLYLGGSDTLPGGAGVLTVSGGAVSVTDTLKLWSGGSLNLSGGQVTTNSLDNSAGGTLNFTGGTLTVDGGTFDPGTPEPTLDGVGNPTLNLINGATASAANPLTVGNFENATLNVNSASQIDSDYSLIGLQDGSAGAVTVDAATWTNGGSLTVGHLGDGELTITNGGLVTTMFSWLARNSDATGQVMVDGGTWTHSKGLVVGQEGNGSLTITNGGQVTDEGAEVGWLSGSVGEVTVDGSTWDNDSMHIGYEGNGVVNIINDGQVTSIDSGIAWFAGSTGSVTVGGSGSSWTNTRDLFIGGRSSSAGGTGELTVSSGGTVNVTRNLKFWPGGTLNVNGGSVSVGSVWSDGGTVNLTAGSINCSGDLLIGPGGLPSTDLTLGPLVTLSVDGATTIDVAATVTLNDGRFSTGSLTPDGAFAFNSGTFDLTDDDLTIGGGGLFGDTLEVGPGKTINVTNTATVSQAGHLLVTGGSFGAGDLVNTGMVELDGATARIGGAALTNQSVLTGSGRVNAALSNTAAGHVQIGAGQRMIFTGAGNSNAGSFDVIGGEAQFTGDLTNEASTGMIAGRDATLRFGGGLTNAGLVAMSFGTSDVFGDVVNEATGRIVISGGGNATFYDDLVNNGEVQISVGSTAVYFGDVTGSGSFSGTGTNYFEGDLYPGSSPAELTFGGDVVFGPLAGLEMELGGTVGGDEYDRLDVAGDLTPGGTLQVVLIDEFVPDVGDTFDIFDWGTLAGAGFDAVELPEFIGRKAWDTSALYTDGEIEVIGMLDGDTDVDWDVDSVDLANLAGVFGGAGDWHTDFDEDGRTDLTDFALMRANFGAGVGSSPGGAPETATPEPASAVLLLLGLGAVIYRRKK
jgi:T5SS/PEP-CTERM-associated repeat protein